MAEALIDEGIAAIPCGCRGRGERARTGKKEDTNMWVVCAVRRQNRAPRSTLGSYRVVEKMKVQFHGKKNLRYRKNKCMPNVTLRFVVKYNDDYKLKISASEHSRKLQRCDRLLPICFLDS
jgi:hypothetical protein